MNLEQDLLGARFQNPVLLASGTCGYGRELDGLIDLDRLGGLVIKAVTPEPREGNPPPRVAEYRAGMINSVGLANVGLERVAAEKLPWLAGRLRRAQVLVNVAGRSIEDYVRVIERLDPEPGFLGFELNLSCPNVEEGGAVFSTREDLLAEVIRAARAATRRPLIAKLAPNVPDIGRMAEVAVDAGADALTLINTFPGLLFDIETRRPLVGAGSGGISGPAILPMGVHAVWRARQRVRVPILGAGGVRSGADALQYLLAGASLVQIGTALFSDPRTPERVLTELGRYARRQGVTDIREWIGAGAAP
ncbi:MAG TPA: dihydroorotate dehydrogenase [Longimicrobiales bacterium]